MATVPTHVQERVPVPVQATGPSAAAPAITPGDVIGMLRRRLVTIIVLSVLFGGMGIGLFFLAWFKFPKYSADALIQCVSDVPRTGFDLDQPTMQADRYTRFVQSQAIFLESYPILSKVLTKPEVRSTQWFQNVPEDERLQALEDDISCAPMRDSNFLRVAMAARNPNDPHVIVNAIVDVYLQETKLQASAPYEAERAQLQRTLAETRDQIRQKQEQIRDFVGQLPAGEVSGDRNQIGEGVIISQLRNQQEKVAELQQQTDELKSTMDIYSDPTRDAVTPEDRLQVEADPRVNQLDNQRFALEQERNILLKDYGPNHRETKEISNRLDEVKQQLEAARANKLREILEYKSTQIETAYYNSQHALIMAQERLQAVQAQQSDLDQKLAEYRMLLDELDLLVDMQNRLEEYLREVDRVVRERSAVRVESAVRATPPQQRSFPQLLMLPLAVIFGGMLAVGTALLLELLDTSVKTSQDVVRHLGVPMLGSIPDVDDEEVEIERVETAVIDAPRSMVTEAFRSLRSNLQFSAPADRMRCILVTSPKPEDGKTSIASNLAASLAIAGRRVLLVDTNLRRPALQRLYPQIGSRGMTNILIGDAKIDECIHSTKLANLDVIGCGPIPPNPAELLGSELFRSFLTEVTRRYDHVLFDSPPVLVASDATVLGALVDGTILVCRAKSNSRGVGQRAISLLENVNAHVYGAVLNVAQARRGGYFREQLRTFYEYHEEELPERERRALPSDDAPRDGESPDTGGDTT